MGGIQKKESGREGEEQRFPFSGPFSFFWEPIRKIGVKGPAGKFE